MESPLALYRRYRPETFAEVIGQEHVTEPLRAALAGNRVNHAYLFSGPRGCGKTTSARICPAAVPPAATGTTASGTTASGPAAWPTYRAGRPHRRQHKGPHLREGAALATVLGSRARVLDRHVRGQRRRAAKGPSRTRQSSRTLAAFRPWGS